MHRAHQDGHGPEHEGAAADGSTVIVDQGRVLLRESQGRSCELFLQGHFEGGVGVRQFEFQRGQFLCLALQHQRAGIRQIAVYDARRVRDAVCLGLPCLIRHGGIGLVKGIL
ncbi:hypothetical protein SDC9_158594 [bioreactor metagenome]|uniref:Uncharacterized protein n=1 Tax=bioreactor metagenome TaxID=1076179 RepID=A0A645FFZ8_9ZZZZ